MSSGALLPITSRAQATISSRGPLRTGSGCAFIRVGGAGAASGRAWPALRSYAALRLRATLIPSPSLRPPYSRRGYALKARSASRIPTTRQRGCAIDGAGPSGRRHGGRAAKTDAVAQHHRLRRAFERDRRDDRACQPMHRDRHLGDGGAERREPCGGRPDIGAGLRRGVRVAEVFRHQRDLQSLDNAPRRRARTSQAAGSPAARRARVTRPRPARSARVRSPLRPPSVEVDRSRRRAVVRAPNA